MCRGWVIFLFVLATATRDAFRIVEDGTPQRVDVFSGEDSPLTVGLLVDSSGSMRGGRARVAATPLATFHPTRYAMASFADFESLSPTLVEDVWCGLATAIAQGSLCK
jgi:hypothetical protein